MPEHVPHDGVWSADRSATVAAHMCDDAPNPWVNSTTGPDPVASWKIKVLTILCPLSGQKRRQNRQGRAIIPAAAVWLVASSISTKLPVARLRR